MRSIAIDLKHPDSIRAFHKIIEGADVFIDGLRPGVTKSLGIDYDSLKAINPGIVTMSLSAFGQTGPRSEENTSELQSLMRIQYDVFCLKNKNTHQQSITNITNTDN